MRFAVLGAAGQLGRELCPLLPGDVVPLSRAEIDLARPESIRAAVAALAVDVFVNCAAYNLVDRAESEPEAAFRVNTWAVRELVQSCRSAGIKLVHFSSDYVFGLDRTRTEPYAETDPPGPLSVYGLSKLAGEYTVRARCPDALVVRTCGLYGPMSGGGKGGNFVETMLRLAAENRPIRVVDDQRCTPSYTVDVAEATAQLVRSGATGLFHVTNGGSCTWYEFADAIFRLSGLKPNLSPVRSKEFAAAAERPGFSVLSCKNLDNFFVRLPRPWPEALASYLEKRPRSSI